jgi:hypothetical protein
VAIQYQLVTGQPEQHKVMLELEPPCAGVGPPKSGGDPKMYRLRDVTRMPRGTVGVGPGLKCPFLHLYQPITVVGSEDRRVW